MISEAFNNWVMKMCGIKFQEYNGLSPLIIIALPRIIGDIKLGEISKLLCNGILLHAVQTMY